MAFKPAPKTNARPAAPVAPARAPARPAAQAPQEPVNTSCIEVTQVEVRQIPNPQGKTLGFANVVLGEALALNDIRVIEGSKGLFCGWPERPYETQEGTKYAKQWCPITGVQRNAIQEAVLGEWERTVGGGAVQEELPVQDVRSAPRRR